MSNTIRTNLFVGNIVQIQRHLKVLTEHVNEHLGADPDDISWSDAGEASRIANEVWEIIVRLKLTENE